jgi:MFS family permease
MQNSPPTSPPVPRESILAAMRTFPRPVWVLFAGVFLNKFGTFVVPFLTLYLTRRGFSAADAGLALGAYGFGRLGAALFGGQLADTIGRRKTIVISMALAAASMLALAHAETLPMIVLLTGLASLTGELYVPACVALLGDLVPEHRRVTVFAAYRMSFNAGWAFGPATAAFLASHSMKWLFIGDAITSILFGVVAWFWLPRHVRSREPEAGWREAWGTICRDQRLHQVAIATIFVGFIVHQMVSSYGLHVTKLGFSDAVYGALLSFNGVLVVLCELPITLWSRRLPPRTAMACGYALMGLAMMLNLVLHTVPALACGMALFTLGEIIFAPIASAYVAGLAPQRMRGRYIGTWAFANSLSLMFGPGLGVTVFSWNPAVLWLGCGALGFAAAAIMLARTQMRRAPFPAVVAVQPPP